MTQIKFGTDGWRAIIAKDYTVDNVARVAKATADWLKKNNKEPKVVIGYDCRFGGLMFTEVTTSILCAEGVKVLMAKGFVSTPMISFGTHVLKADAGVVITASHNPPSYNGYKIKSHFGGPATPASIAEVEELIPEQTKIPKESLDEWEKRGLLEYVDLETMYVEHVKKNFDIDLIRKSGLKIGYDAMFGAGQNVVRKLLPEATLVRAEYNPGFGGMAPEPLDKYMQELAQTIRDKKLDIGVATDGDADRIALMDNTGTYIDAHHILLLLIHYLHKYKEMTGKVVVAFSVSNKVKKLCEAYGLECQVTKIGFKYICEIMVNDDVLVGGEESGGIAVKGHVPERDGIWDALVLIEFMAKTGKTLNELIDEVYEVVGPFKYGRNDLHLSEELKQQIIDNCRNGEYKSFGPYEILGVETIDGFKYTLEGDRTIMIRPSGTEPVLRVYGEAPDMQQVEETLKAARETLLKEQPQVH